MKLLWRKNKVQCLFGHHDVKTYVKEIDFSIDRLMGPHMKVAYKCTRCKLERVHYESFEEFDDKRPNLSWWTKCVVFGLSFGSRQSI